MKIPDFKLERYFAEYEFSTKYLLSSSDCEALSIQDLLKMERGAAERFNQHWLGYTESQGSPTLREEISGIYQDITANQILVHSGAEEGIFIFMHAYLNPGDHIIVHWPGYQSLYQVAESLGCQVSYWIAEESANWELDLDHLQDLVRSNTKAIVINTPHNPTGFLMSLESLNKLYNFAEANGIVLFSDEVYRESEHDPDNRLPAACDLGDSALSLGVMSKTYGLAGLRIGWITTKNQALLHKMARMKDYTTICNSAPSEFLAEIALRKRDKISSRNLDIIYSNLLVLDAFFDRHQELFRWKKPIAGPIAFPKLIGNDVESFCQDLVNNAGVLLLPGTVFDHPGNHFRIGFGRRNMPEAISRLDEHLNS
jgi:aspartate/methionine/tyrosine aminotransferase